MRSHLSLTFMSAGRAGLRRRSAFSLIEMMIAIVLLGLGMIMVATMFPVAWTRARQLSELTNLTAVVEAADATVRLLASVDGRLTEGSSFAGDLVYLQDGLYGFDYSDIPNPPPMKVRGGIVTFSDTRVHAMCLENILVGGPARKFEADLPAERSDVAYAVADPTQLSAPEYHDALFISPQVRFESRVHPPMRKRLLRDLTKPDPTWDETLDSRRYAWAVLHRLRTRIAPDALPEEQGREPGFRAEIEACDHINDRRDIDLYYVMLRRPQANLRYAQQDQRSAPNPFLFEPVPVVPKAQPPTKDVLLPVPWRVQLFFRGPFAEPNSADENGVPSEIEINPPNPDPSSAAFVADMFAVGAFFIDEVNGNVYRVTQRRFAGPNQEHAYITVDRQILTTDVPPNDPSCPSSLCWQLRTVWVYPPPVLPERLSDANRTPVFTGSPPVVGIEMRSVDIAPRQ